MEALKIPVEQLREGPRELELDMAPEALDLSDPEFTFSGRVTGRVTFRMAAGDVIANGELHVPYDTRCVRCLDPSSGEVSAPVNETWLRGESDLPPAAPGEDEPLVNTYQGDFIEPAEVFRELIMAALPERVWCREDCAGLCPGCGANLNHEPCRCPEEVRRAREDAQASDWKLKLRQLQKPKE